MTIHPTAVISPHARLGERVSIGPNVCIGDHVEIGSDVTILANAYLTGWTTIGDGTQIHMSAIVGHEPQDLKFDPQMKSFVRVGKNNVIREFATIHRGSVEGSATVLGDGNYLMAGAHVGHDCRIGNNTVLVNNVLLGGHVTVEDQAIISGGAAAHQFSRIGKLAMVGGLTRVNEDVPPFMLVRNDSQIYSLNLVGLRRAGFGSARIGALKQAFKVLLLHGHTLKRALEELERGNVTEDIRYLIDFIRSSKRGICQAAPGLLKAARIEDEPGH